MRRQPERKSAPDVTACIPTVGDGEDVVTTVGSLLSGTTCPATILVSDGSDEERAHAALTSAIDLFRDSDAIDVRLLPPPPRGTAAANRNWLARHVETPLLLFVDDDVDVHPDFLHDALARIEHQGGDIVVAASTTMGGSGWFTARGHFRPIEAGEPIAVGLACSLWRVDLFRSLWIDERIDYGYEDADLSLRLYRSTSPIVFQSHDDFVHRADHDSPTPDKVENAERARGYVSVKRYGYSRLALARFLIIEMASNAARRRRLLPEAHLPGQWSQVARYLAGARAPAWAQADASLVSAPRPRGAES
jgi:GT2 family glycosyltransferase